MWPGYGENSRVLKWVVERAAGTAEAVSTPIGNLPTPGAIDVNGLDVSESDMKELLYVDREAWLAEIESIQENYESYGEKMPKELKAQLKNLKERLS
jgi:phosphoenolpyruvate carboxykinase (GTP)